jgi:hypothetical protein
MIARYKPFALFCSGFFALPSLMHFYSDLWLLLFDLILGFVLGYLARRAWSQFLGLLLLAISIAICRAAYFDWYWRVPGIQFWYFSDLVEETVGALPADVFMCLVGLFWGQRSRVKRVSSDDTA